MSGGRVVAALLQALVLSLVARSVTPAEFGLLGVFLGIATVAQTLIDMGVATFIIRERAAQPQSGAIATAMRINTVSSTALSFLTAIVLVAAGFLISPAWFFLLPLSIWIGAERNADARISIALADGDAWINVSNLVGRRLLATAMLIGLVSLGVDGIFAYSIALAIAAAGSSVFANVYVRARVTPRGVGYGEVLAKSRPYWVHSVATQSRNLDATIVGAVAGATAAGLYSAGSRLTNPLSILPYSLATVLLPEATRAHAAGRSLRPSVLLAATMVSVATALYLTLIPLTPWLVSSVLGAAYEGSVVIIQIVLIGFPFAAGTSLVHALLQAIGRKNVVAASSTIFATLTLVGAMVGALLTGAVGAAIALSAVTATQFVYLLVWLIASLRRAGRRTDLSGDEFVV